jgi:tetratricopeptide (TPR) repeat protein
MLGINLIIKIILVFLTLGLVIGFFGPGLKDAEGGIWSPLGEYSFESFMEKGDTHYTKSDFSKAIKDYEKAIKASKTSSDEKEIAYLKIALCSVEMGREAKAKKYLELILKENNARLNSDTKEKINSVIEKLDMDINEWTCCDFGTLGDFYLKSSCNVKGDSCEILPDIMFE